MYLLFISPSLWAGAHHRSLGWGLRVPVSALQLLWKRRELRHGLMRRLHALVVWESSLSSITDQWLIRASCFVSL